MNTTFLGFLLIAESLKRVAIKSHVQGYALLVDYKINCSKNIVKVFFNMSSD